MSQVAGFPVLHIQGVVDRWCSRTGLGVAYYLLQKWIELAALKERLSSKKQTVRERVLTFENDLQGLGIAYSISYW
jgi:hypothetical protein